MIHASMKLMSSRVSVDEMLAKFKKYQFCDIQAYV